MKTYCFDAVAAERFEVEERMIEEGAKTTPNRYLEYQRLLSEPLFVLASDVKARDAKIKELLEQIKKDSHGGVIYINAQEALSLLLV